MPQQALLIIAHGSREPQANQEVEELAQLLLQQGISEEVRAAFLDPVARPTIPEAIDQLIKEGVTTITALPYFLNSGKHVQHDIPEIIKQKCDQHVGVRIVLTEHIGAHPEIIQLIKAIVSR